MYLTFVLSIFFAVIRKGYKETGRNDSECVCEREREREREIRGSRIGARG